MNYSAYNLAVPDSAEDVSLSCNYASNTFNFTDGTTTVECDADRDEATATCLFNVTVGAGCAIRMWFLRDYRMLLLSPILV